MIFILQLLLIVAISGSNILKTCEVNLITILTKQIQIRYRRHPDTLACDTNIWLIIIFLHAELPFRDNTIDVIICDTPFGINHSSREGVVDLYPSMVTEINRYIIFFMNKSYKWKKNCFSTITTVIKKWTKVTIILFDTPLNTSLGCLLIFHRLFVSRITKVGARIVLLTSQALKEKLLETVSKICGLCLDSKVSVQKATFYNEADTRSSQWCLKCSKYLKLGETDSRVLSFSKQKIKK